MPSKRITQSQQIAELKKEIYEIKNKTVSNAKTNADNFISKPASRVYRVNSDLERWRYALNISEQIINPLWGELIRLYNEVELDSTVTSSKDIRKNFVLSRDYYLYDEEDNVDDRATKFFNRRWLNKFIDYTLEQEYWGYSLIQLGDIDLDKQELSDVFLIQRQNVNPFYKTILKTPFANANSVSFEDDKLSNWYIFVSTWQNFHYQGLYSKVTPYQVMLKIAQISMDDYANRFGSPNPIVATDMTNTEQVKNIERYLSNLNNQTYAIIGKEDTVTYLEGSGKSSDIYDGIIDEMKENISRLILGTNLAEENSFVGSSEIRMQVSNMYSQFDITLVENVINDCLIPRLINLGCTFLKGIRFDFDKSVKADPTQELAVIQGILGTGQFTISPDTLLEKFGIAFIPLNPQIFPDEDQKSTGESDVQK